MANSEIRQCQSCKNTFEIDAQDFQFYEKIKVPPPTWCPECRNIRRMTWREDHTLYKSVCALCKKPTLSIYAPEGPFTVYCRECWWSDKWDSLDYGREYDFSRPFFSQFRELIEAVPRAALTGTGLVNSEYCHASQDLKNCYLVFWGYRSENVQYSFAPIFSRDSCDMFTVENSDHAYEASHSNRLYRTRFAYFSEDCMDSAFLWSCAGCSDCFGCVNLRKQKYSIFNQQFSKEEYLKQMEYWDLGSHTRLEEAKDKFKKLLLSVPQRYSRSVNAVNCSGDVIRDAKNCQSCFSVVSGAENCKYIYFGGLGIKDSYDMSSGGNMSELNYEIMGLTAAQRVFFSVGGGDYRDVYYSTWPDHSSNMFGSAFIRHKKYCILNKQYSPSEYEVMVAKIKKHMDEMPYVDQRGRVYKYGEFFPSELSAFAYNESAAMSWYPKTKQEALSQGFSWKDVPAKERQATTRASDLPDHIRDVKDDILEETILCAHQGKCNEQCGTAFRLTATELNFYREMNLALPRFCPNCRLVQRRGLQNGFKTWNRKCQCAGKISENSVYENTARHEHGESPCGESFQTTFSPERFEIIYCDKCYKAEFF